MGSDPTAELVVVSGDGFQSGCCYFQSVRIHLNCRNFTKLVISDNSHGLKLCERYMQCCQNIR